MNVSWFREMQRDLQRKTPIMHGCYAQELVVFVPPL